MEFRIDNEWPKGIKRPCLDSLIVDVRCRIWTCTAIGWEWTELNGQNCYVWCITITESETGREWDMSFVEALKFFSEKQMAVFGQKPRENNA